MTKAVVEKLLADLGFTAESHRHVMGASSFEEAQQRLDELKREAKRRYRKLALELHPDRTGGDPDKAEQFKVLAQVWDQVEKIEIRRPAPPPTFLTIQIYTGTAASTTSTSTTTTFVNFRRL